MTELHTIELLCSSSASFLLLLDAIAVTGSTRFRFTRGSPSAFSAACRFVPALALGGAV